MENKITTSEKNARWYTTWKKRMENGKPREGDYNFVLWKNGSETIVEPFDNRFEPAVYQNGKWISLIEMYNINNGLVEDVATE